MRFIYHVFLFGAESFVFSMLLPRSHCERNNVGCMAYLLIFFRVLHEDRIICLNWRENMLYTHCSSPWDKECVYSFKLKWRCFWGIPVNCNDYCAVLSEKRFFFFLLFPDFFYAKRRKKLLFSAPFSANPLRCLRTSIISDIHCKS